MARATDRRVHLYFRAQTRIVLGAQRQMMRRRLAARDILGAGQKVHLLARRDMQDMHLRARLARQANEPLGRTQSRNFVAPDGMRGRIAGDAQGLALI